MAFELDGERASKWIRFWGVLFLDRNVDANKRQICAPITSSFTLSKFVRAPRGVRAARAREGRAPILISSASASRSCDDENGAPAAGPRVKGRRRAGLDECTPDQTAFRRELYACLQCRYRAAVAAPNIKQASWRTSNAPTPQANATNREVQRRQAMQLTRGLGHDSFTLP